MGSVSYAFIAYAIAYVTYCVVILASLRTYDSGAARDGANDIQSSALAISPCTAACALASGLDHAEKCCRGASTFLHDLPHIVASARGSDWICAKLLCGLAGVGMVEQAVCGRNNSTYIDMTLWYTQAAAVPQV